METFRKTQNIDEFVTNDETKIKWSSRLKETFGREQYAQFNRTKIRQSLYRPFSKKFIFFDNILNHRQGITPKAFPIVEAEKENRVIWLKVGSDWPMFALMSNSIVDLLPQGGSQCFPFYVYDEDGSNRRENITDWALGEFRGRYETLTPRPPLPQVEGESPTHALKVPLHEGEGRSAGVRVSDDAVFRAKAAEVMTTVARELRQRQTPAEELLWQHLRDRRLDKLKFRRQNAIENTAYVVDFLCYEARLVVELDGGIHATQAKDDAFRQENIEAQGYKVIRFTNDQLASDLESVLATIIAAARTRIDSLRPVVLLTSASDSPLPQGEGLGVRVIEKWDIFYYVYALLHHPEYRSNFADNLKRELPRIPFAPDFWAFAEAGRKLADLHLNYETVERYKLEWVTKEGKPINYRVEKMKFTKDNDLVYNDTLTLKGIPAEAFEYKLGNRSALHWIVDQYQVSTDKRSGITSDPNRYSDDERYIVNLVERVTRVSVETVATVNGLPGLG